MLTNTELDRTMAAPYPHCFTKPQAVLRINQIWPFAFKKCNVRFMHSALMNWKRDVGHKVLVVYILSNELV